MARWIEAIGQDLRYAVRGLRKSPGFTLVSVLTLAIGIGGTTAVFSVINGILLRPLPYPDQDRLVAVSNVDLKEPKYSLSVSTTDVAHWRVDNRVFETLEFVSHADMVAMSSAGSGERVGVQHMSARLLPLLGVKAFMGSIPTDDLSEQKGSFGLVISYEFWKRHFGGDPNIVGKEIFVDTFSGTIVGVLEPGFDLLGTGTPEVYTFGGMGNPSNSGVDDVRWFTAIGKLKRGVSIQQAQAAMEVTTRALGADFSRSVQRSGNSGRATPGSAVRELGRGLFRAVWNRCTRSFDCLRKCRQSFAGSRRRAAEGDRRTRCLRSKQNEGSCVRCSRKAFCSR